MNSLQKFTIFVGCTGILLNITGVITGITALSYSAIFVGRLAALLFSVAIDKVRPFYFVPITLSFINAFLNIEQLLFVELVLQSIVYQISAYRLFTGRMTVR